MSKNNNILSLQDLYEFKVENKNLIQDALSEFHRKKIRIVSKLNKKDSGLLQINQSNTQLTFRSSSESKEAGDAKEVDVAEEAIEEEIKKILAKQGEGDVELYANTSFKHKVEKLTEQADELLAS